MGSTDGADGLGAFLAELPRERTHLLENLGRIRREVGPVTPERSDALADHMNLRRGDVDEVVSFYSYLTVPLDAVRICTGPVCDCLGARELLAQAHQHAPPDRRVLEVPCLGHCDLAPAGTRGDAVLPRLTVGALDAALAGSPPAPIAHRTNSGPSIALGESDELRRPPELSPDRVLAELKASGLVGYGGAGFPAWRKWELVRREPGPRVLVVNADEGEPGTVKDRYVMELRPELLLEGIEIALRFLESNETIVYLREEYATARERLREAIAARGLPVRIIVGAGSYVCGEETALLESLEGRRGMPRLRPPYPAQHGYLGRPTLVNNVETLAHVPAIVRNGGAWFADLGLRGASGARLWSISGAVHRPGCYEAPNGSTLRELIERLAGGASEEIGAIVPGGAASGILPPAALDTPLTPEGLAEWGAGVGSGGVQVFPERYPLMRLLAETTRFFAEESCQKCTPCRIGTRALRHVIAELEDGRPAMPRAQLDEWLETMERGSICGLGQTAPLPLRNAIRHWPELFEVLG